MDERVARQEAIASSTTYFERTMKKTYILDTSVLIHDPNSFRSFKGNEVIIPINVLDELDKLKTFPSDAGKNARVCIRYLDELCKKGTIHKGIKIDNNVTLKIDATQTADDFGPASYVDNKILACAYAVQQKNNKKKVPTETVLVSRDINLRVRGRASGIVAENYEKDGVAVNDMYQGFRTIVCDELGETLAAKDFLDCSITDEVKDMHPNECVHFVSEKGDGLAIGRRVGNRIVQIKNNKPWGLDMRNKEQAFAADMLCDPKLPLVSLIGRAGTGKTLIALASALHMVLEKKAYSKLIIYRPIQPVGNDIGYLPGTMEEKLGPWMQAIADSFEFLFSAKAGHKWQMTMDRYLTDGTIQMDAITYIRGRSIPNAFILIDETQNLKKDDVKTILTRAGTGTKIVLTGDVEQIDNTGLDATNNGLSYIVEKFKSEELAGHVSFAKGERSPLATKAAEIL